MRSSLVTVLLAGSLLGATATPLCAQGATAPPAAPAKPTAPPTAPARPTPPPAPVAPIPPIAKPTEATTPAAPATAPANLPSARSLVDKFIAAIGGEARLRKNTSRKSTIKFELTGMSNMAADMVLIQKAPNMLLMTVEIPGIGQMKQGFDGTTGWASDPMQGARVVQGEELSQLKREAEFLRELKMFDIYKKVETVGAEQFNGVDCWKVALTDESGDVENAFFDKNTGLLQGLMGVMKSPAGELPTQTTFKEYKDFDGLKLASRTEMTVMGNTQTLTLEKLEFDVVDDAMLAPPDDVKAIVKAAEAAKGAAPAAPTTPPAAAPGTPGTPAAPGTPATPTAPTKPATPPAAPPVSK